MRDFIYQEVQGNLFTPGYLSEYFHDIDVKKADEILRRKIDEHGFDITNEYNMSAILVHLLLIIEYGKRISDAEISEVPVVSADKVEQLVSEILEEIRKDYDIEYNASEFERLCLLIEISTKNEFDDEEVIAQLGEEVYELTIRIIHEVYNEFLIDLSSTSFIARFGTHIKYLISAHRRELSNPLLNSIRDASPAVFEIAFFIASIIHTHYPDVVLNDDEVSYIALHIGTELEEKNMTRLKGMLINPSYNNVNEMILQKIENNFPEIDIVKKVFSPAETDALKGSSDIDIIISTVDVKSLVSYKFVKVSPFINYRDISNIRDKIDDINYRSIRKQSDDITGYFGGAFHYFEDNHLSKEEVIRTLCELSDLDESFVQRVLVRQNLSPTDYMNMVLAHPIESNEADTFISVGVFKKPMRWNVNDINVVFLLSVAKEDRHDFVDMLSGLINTFSTREWNEVYSQIDTYDKLIDFIRKK